MRLFMKLQIVICKNIMYLIFLLFISIPGPSYSADSKCAKTIRKSSPAVKKNEVARLSRVNFVHNAVESIINSRILSYSHKGEFVSSIRNKNLDVWIRKLEEEYKTDQSVISFEMFEPLFNEWESKKGNQAKKLEKPGHKLIFVEDGMGTAEIDTKKRERNIQKLRQMAQWYNEGDLIRLSQFEVPYSSRFSNSIKRIMFAYWLKLPAEKIQELILKQLKKERRNHNLASYIRRSLNLYSSFDQTKALAKGEDLSLEHRAILPALQKAGEKEEEFFEEMGLFLLVLIEKMDPALLKNLIMLDLFLLLRLHTA